MGRKRSTAKLISEITGELAVTALDFVVLSSAFAGGLILFGPRGKDLYAEKHLNDAFRATTLMYNKWDKSAFRRAAGRAAGEGLVKRITDGFELTESGKQRLRELLPEYKKPQPWNGRLWLVSYDITSDKRRTRDRFRDWLETIGCRMIQESMWVSIKDPRDWIKESISSMKKRSVIVSCLGKDGSIGEEDLSQLVIRVFRLKPLAKAYRNWLKAAERIADDKNENKVVSLGWRYLTLLRNDPMLPAELLPKGWPGKKAMEVFETEVEPRLGSIGDYLQI